MQISQAVISLLKSYFVSREGISTINGALSPATNESANLGEPYRRFDVIYARAIVADSIGYLTGGINNADTVDSLHAAPLPSPGALLALDENGIFPPEVYPSALLTNGSRALTADLSVDSGVKIDGIDISAHAANGFLHHLMGMGADDHEQYFDVNRHTKTVHDNLGLDHGSLSGLADDDHSQYYNSTRHTAAVHDALNINADRLDGNHATAFEPAVTKQNVTAGSNKITLGGTPTGAAFQPFSVDVDQTKIDHNSLLNYAANRHSKIRTYSWIVSAPVAGRILGPRVPEGYTVTRLDAVSVGASSYVGFNIEEVSTPGSAGTNIMTSELEGDPDGAYTTTFSNAGLAAGCWLVLEISYLANAPSQFVATLTCEVA